MRPLQTSESGSALVEAAIVLPCLVLIVCGSAALTDALVLKLKAAEALRYALWESTVFKPPGQIDLEVQQRFADLRSPRGLNLQHTGLLLYPWSRDLSWRADLDTTSAEAGLGGAAAAAMKFNTHGVALARISLRARHGAHSLAFQAPLAAQRPMQLIFDPWKAWPKPAAYTFNGADADPAVPPSRTYPEVEKQVSAQVRAIAFLGANRVPGFRALSDLIARISRLGVTDAMAGGTLPDVFSAGRMDEPASGRGPITILPPERAGPSWVPQRCEIAGKDVPCPTQRAGDVTTSGALPRRIDDEHGIGDQVDRTRYTVPYRIHTSWWKRSGGVSRALDSSELQPVKGQLATENEYVRSYRCRGHFFGGSRTAQRPDAFGSCR